MTQPDPDDPLKDKYGDSILVQSQAVTGRKWTPVLELTPALKDQEVLLRGRIHKVRGKGKSAFIVLRQRTATVQVQRHTHAHTHTHMHTRPPPQSDRYLRSLYTARPAAGTVHRPRARCHKRYTVRSDLSIS